MFEEAQKKLHVVFPVKGKAVKFRMDQIAWLQAQRNCTLVWVGDRAHPVRRPLKKVLQELDPKTFVRVHRSAAVNMSSVKSIRLWVSGHHEIELQSGEMIVASRHRPDLLKVFRSLAAPAGK